jgi:hypothetical protein
MPRGSSRHTAIQEELQQLEAALAALTLQVAHLRSQAAGRTDISPSIDENGREIRIGDPVSFKLAGQLTEGIVIGLTPHRIRIRQDRTHHIFLRAPHNVTRLTTHHHVN